MRELLVAFLPARGDHDAQERNAAGKVGGPKCGCCSSTGDLLAG